ncbi:hypothetical protein J6590_080486, partial [Homalodisca vitripennis]
IKLKDALYTGTVTARVRAARLLLLSKTFKHQKRPRHKGPSILQAFVYIGQLFSTVLPSEFHANRSGNSI